jgi:hypothetical protein
MVRAAGLHVRAIRFLEARRMEDCRNLGHFFVFQVLGFLACLTRFPVSPGTIYVISR